MTQKDLSAKTGITQADISRIENGTRNPSLSMVKKLAQGLGMQLKLEFFRCQQKIKCNISIWVTGDYINADIKKAHNKVSGI